MAKQVTFTVSKPGAGLKTECTFNAPENVSDPRWKEIVKNPDEDVNELAVQNLIIKIQAGARNELAENGADAAQKYVDTYQYRAGGGGFKRPTISASVATSLQFSPAQLEALRLAGVKFTTAEEDAAAEAELAGVEG